MPLSNNRKKRVNNGKTQYLNSLKAEIIINDSDKATLSKTYEELKTTNEGGLLRLPRSTLIVGGGVYNGSFHPHEEAQKSFPTMSKQPFNVNHSDDIVHETGWWVNPEYNKDTYKISAIPILNLNTPFGEAALQHIRNRMLAGKPAELSVGFWATEKREVVELDNEKTEMYVVRDWEFDHCSLVTRGACSPADGAGIGLKQNKMEERSMSEEDPKAGDVKPEGTQTPTEPPAEPPKEAPKEDKKGDTAVMDAVVMKNPDGSTTNYKREEPVSDPETFRKEQYAELEEQAKIQSAAIDQLSKKVTEMTKPTRNTLTREDWHNKLNKLEPEDHEDVIAESGLGYLTKVGMNLEAPPRINYKEKHPYKRRRRK